MADVAETSNGAVSKKPRLVENYYEDKAGNKLSRPQPDVVKVGKKFLQSGHVEEITLSNVPPAQLLQAAAFGLQQVGQNAYGAAGDENERIDMCQDRWNTIMAGSWASERQSGPSTSDLLEAYCQAKQEHTGKAVSEEDRNRIREKLASEEITSKGLMENPKIAAKFHAIKAQRAAERAKAAAEKADGDTAEVSFDL